MSLFSTLSSVTSLSRMLSLGFLSGLALRLGLDCRLNPGFTWPKGRLLSASCTLVSKSYKSQLCSFGCTLFAGFITLFSSLFSHPLCAMSSCFSSRSAAPQRITRIARFGTGFSWWGSAKWWGTWCGVCNRRTWNFFLTLKASSLRTFNCKCCGRFFSSLETWVFSATCRPSRWSGQFQLLLRISSISWSLVEATVGRMYGNVRRSCQSVFGTFLNR